MVQFCTLMQRIVKFQTYNFFSGLMQCKLREMLQKLGCLQFRRGWKLLELQNLSIYPRSYQRHQSQKKGHLFSPKLEGQLPTRHMTHVVEKDSFTKKQEKFEKNKCNKTLTLFPHQPFSRVKNQVGREFPLLTKWTKQGHSLEIFQFSCPEKKRNLFHPRSKHASTNQVWAQGTTPKEFASTKKDVPMCSALNVTWELQKSRQFDALVEQRKDDCCTRLSFLQVLTASAFMCSNRLNTQYTLLILNACTYSVSLSQLRSSRHNSQNMKHPGVCADQKNLGQNSPNRSTTTTSPTENSPKNPHLRLRPVQ